MKMKDRYLYKAKRVDDGEWIVGYLYRLSENNPPFIMLRKYGERYEVDEHTICQCTGLKDKNGNLIYENDILMCHGSKKDIVKVVYGKFAVIDIETLKPVDCVIGWHYEVIQTDTLSKLEPFNLSMPLTDEYIKTCEFEVIGNIFDNPELLESEGND